MSNQNRGVRPPLNRTGQGRLSEKCPWSGPGRDDARQAIDLVPATPHAPWSSSSTSPFAPASNPRPGDVSSDRGPFHHQLGTRWYHSGRSRSGGSATLPRLAANLAGRAPRDQPKRSVCDGSVETPGRGANPCPFLEWGTTSREECSRHLHTTCGPSGPLVIGPAWVLTSYGVACGR